MLGRSGVRQSRSASPGHRPCRIGRTRILRTPVTRSAPHRLAKAHQTWSSGVSAAHRKAASSLATAVRATLAGRFRAIRRYLLESLRSARLASERAAGDASMRLRLSFTPSSIRTEYFVAASMSKRRRWRLPEAAVVAYHPLVDAQVELGDGILALLQLAQEEVAGEAIVLQVELEVPQRQAMVAGPLGPAPQARPRASRKLLIRCLTRLLSCFAAQRARVSERSASDSGVGGDTSTRSPLRRK